MRKIKEPVLKIDVSTISDEMKDLLDEVNLEKLVSKGLNEKWNHVKAKGTTYT